MTALEKPIARITEISLTCSYRLPVIDEDSGKKQMNMVMVITTLKISSIVDSAYGAKSRFGLDSDQKSS